MIRREKAQVDTRAPLGYLGPFALEGVKEVTWQPNRLFDAKYMNPYSPFYAETRDAPFEQFGVEAQPPSTNPPSSPAATPDNGASRMGVGSAVFAILVSVLALAMH
ncbi:hypothetical protein DUNSADRAFT_18275 [Dunaliella salina]|uniref:Encoded protein n=1 Tax=Dunaliella salina TaxID=3046 RepID=A0ABQ7G0H7_DUNSA|nr:hypothetical protein DUNSADRAFT_18275 [Dunaliella salina]|eukprot:KAF5828065.1 hypothetical protein DUNSADRAFT_18275 [Dunaliella salina]